MTRATAATKTKIPVITFPRIIATAEMASVIIPTAQYQSGLFST